MPRLFRRSLHLVIAVTALVLVTGSFIVRVAAWNGMEESIERTMHAMEVRDDLELLYSLLVDAEAGQRGYILSGAPAEYVLWNQSAQALRDHYRDLEGDLKSPEVVAADLEELRELKEQKLHELSEGVARRQSGGREAGLQALEQDAGITTMQRIRTVIARMKDAQEAYYHRINDDRKNRTAAALLWTSVAGVSGIVAGVAALWMFMAASRHAAAEIQAEQRASVAEEVGKQKSAFLANMSHEIRTPMNAVLGFTELLEKDPLSERQQAYLHSVKQAGRSLLQLINDILDLSKVEAGMIELHLEPVDIRDAGEFVRTVIGQACVEKGLDLRLDFPDTLPKSLLLDEGRIRQILVNLAGNAERFTEKGYVRVRAAVTSPSERRSFVTLKLMVEDTGIGIPEDKHDAIFNPFVQAESRRYAEKKGTGLGLSIVRRLVELMGGTVSVQSAPGKGSTFTVEIPGVEVSARLPAGQDGSAEPRVDLDDLRPAEILVVDDNPVNRDLVAGIFEGTRHRVRFASNGEEALASISDRKPEVVLMDLRMPVMSGTEAVKRMRLEPATGMIPVIAVTASSLLNDEEKHRLHFNAYLRKPFSRAELYRELAQFIPRSKQNGDGLPALPDDIPRSQAHATAWQTAARKLRQMEVSTWHALQHTLAITEAREFADRLFLLGEATDCPPLRTYAEILRRHTERFAADELEEHLASFPQLIAVIEKRTAVY